MVRKDEDTKFAGMNLCLPSGYQFSCLLYSSRERTKIINNVMWLKVSKLSIELSNIFFGEEREFSFEIWKYLKGLNGQYVIMTVCVMCGTRRVLVKKITCHEILYLKVILQDNNMCLLCSEP